MIEFVFGFARAGDHRDQLAEVGAGAERAAFAGDHDDANVVVVFRGAPRVGEAHGNFGIDRVARVGTVQRDDRHVAFYFVVNQCHVWLLLWFE